MSLQFADNVAATHSLINTSPAPGSGVSNVSFFVEMEPGLSYTIASYCFGISTAAIVTDWGGPVTIFENGSG